ncbi:MAG: pyrroline-5-carboxylate reductase [Rhodobacteraceae bacterium]|nr:pyrroline-5-carboxylate reductase [Paracoccaceae bacterium]
MEIEGLLLLGCGKMGSALLRGWLAGGLPPDRAFVTEPQPSVWLLESGVGVNQPLEGMSVDICVLAIKPQMMAEALETVRSLRGPDTVILSIAAGITLGHLAEVFGAETPVVRAMPNTPAAIGCGISAYVGNAAARENHLSLAAELLGAVGQTVLLTREADIDCVTGVSGSGPAYVFYLIETLARAAEDSGLAADIAMSLAVETVAGAGQLARCASETPEELRRNVTSPRGTTEAALRHLMDPDTGLQPLVKRTVMAAISRSEELGRRE